jgi:hypothetical protein
VPTSTTRRAADVAVHGEQVAAGAQGAAQVLAGVRVPDRLVQPVDPAAVQQVGGQRVEQAGPRPKTRYTVERATRACSATAPTESGSVGAARSRA